MRRPIYYNPQGVPISSEQWEAEWSRGEKNIAYDELPNGLRVSTVYLGLDHNFTRKGPPLIYESMVFPEDSWVDLDMRRYATKEEAEIGHREMVERYSLTRRKDG